MAINAEQAAKEYEQQFKPDIKRAVSKYSDINEAINVEKINAATYNPNELDQILKDRGSKYGLFKNHAELTTSLKRNFLRFIQLNNPNAKFTPSQCEAIDMIFHKLGRIGNGDPDYVDSWRDIAGYATLVADELEGIIR